MSSRIVTYLVDESTAVMFEIEPGAGFQPAGPEQILGKVRDAVSPAVEAARAVLDKVKETGPNQVEVSFGIKVSGEANWLVAKAASEGNFAVTLTWNRDAHSSEAGGT